MTNYDPDRRQLLYGAAAAGGLVLIPGGAFAAERLVAATFGRSFYILDDYTPLRGLTREMLEQEAVLFPVKKALMYIKARPLGGREKASQGDAFFTAPNPPFGAVFTYHLKEGLKTRKKRRQEAEKKAVEEEGEISYPTWDELRLEDRELKPEIILTVKGAMHPASIYGDSDRIWKGVFFFRK